MNLKRLFVAFLFLDFTAYSLWVVFSEGFGPLFEAHSSPWGIQVFVDLILAASFGVVCMYRDAKKRGVNPWPWVIAVPFTGSIALLAYATLYGFDSRDYASAR